MQETNTERHKRVCYELNRLYDQKNRDYGDSFHETFAEEGMASARIRLGDKLRRFKKLTKGQAVPAVANESVRDTLIDLANYAIMTVMEMDSDEYKPYETSEDMAKAIRAESDRWIKEG